MSNMITSVVCFILILLSSGCTHSVYSLNIEPVKFDAVKKSVINACKEEDCVLDDCWQETKSLMVCNVYFSFTDSEAKRKVLESIAKDAYRKGLQVAFCGRDDTSTQWITAGLVSIIVGAYAGSSVGRFEPAVPHTVAFKHVAASSSNELSINVATACDSSPEEDVRVNRRGR
jgi:hypothetical protein